jgi:hypothetical protein
LQQDVTCVVMQATGDNRKPFSSCSRNAVPVMLVNAHHARYVPGRKTDFFRAACWPIWA